MSSWNYIDQVWNRSALWKKKNGIETRWNEHFADILNQKKPVAIKVRGIVPQYPVMREYDREPSVEEVEEALASMPIGKALGAAGMIFLQKEL